MPYSHPRGARGCLLLIPIQTRPPSISSPTCRTRCAYVFGYHAIAVIQIIGNTKNENHRSQNLPDVTPAEGHPCGGGGQRVEFPQLAVREGLHGRGPLGHRGEQRMAAGDRDRGAGHRSDPDRRRPDEHRANLAEDPDRHDGQRHDGDGWIRRDERHRHGAVGHQGQGPQHAGVEPVGREDTGPNPGSTATPPQPTTRWR